MSYNGPTGEIPQHGNIDAMIDRASASKMKTVSIDDDAEMIGMVKHVLKPNETLGEFYARTGLSKSQAALMSKTEILGFCLTAEQNQADEVSMAHQPRVKIPKFIKL